MKALIRGLLGAALTGLLLVLALPPCGVWPLGWVALVPLLLAVREKRFLVSFLFGLAALGFTAVLASSGLFYSDHDTSGEPQWITLGCTLFGFVVALVAAIYGELRAPKLRHLAALAAVAVLFEWSLLNILPVTISLTQAPVTAAYMLASIGGIWLVAFAVWFVNIQVVECTVAKRMPWRGIAAVALIGLCAFVWDRPTAPGNVDAILVQSDSPDVAHLAELSGAHRNALAVWPEFGGLLGVMGGDSQRLKKLSLKAPAFVTSFPDGGTPLPHNAASLFENGVESERYAKRKLFGGEKYMHIAGDRAVSATWNGTRIGLCICFDSCFPGMFRETAANAGFVAVPTIDPPSPFHWIAAMHAAFIPFRAAENGITILRDDGYAFSEAVDPSGRVLASLPPGERVGNIKISTSRRWTLYGQLGDWSLIAILFLAVWPVGLAVAGKVRNRNAAKSADQAIL